MKMAFGGVMIFLVFTSFVSKVKNLKLRSNISQCSDRKLFRMQDKFNMVQVTVDQRWKVSNPY